MTKQQKEALAYLSSVNVPVGDWCGYTSYRSERDKFGAPIHWRTAKALARLGYVKLSEGFRDSEGYFQQDIFLTPAGSKRAQQWSRRISVSRKEEG